MSECIEKLITEVPHIEFNDDSGEDVDLNKPQVKKDSKEKKPKQPKPKPVVDENTPYHMTPKGKREISETL